MTRNDLKRQAEKEWDSNPLLLSEPTTMQKWWATAWSVRATADELVDALRKISRAAEYDETSLRGKYCDDWPGKDEPFLGDYEKALRFHERLSEAKKIVFDALEQNDANTATN